MAIFVPEIRSPGPPDSRDSGPRTAVRRISMAASPAPAAIPFAQRLLRNRGDVSVDLHRVVFSVAFAPVDHNAGRRRGILMRGRGVRRG